MHTDTLITQCHKVVSHEQLFSNIAELHKGHLSFYNVIILRLTLLLSPDILIILTLAHMNNYQFFLHSEPNKLLSDHITQAGTQKSTLCSCLLRNEQVTM